MASIKDMAKAYEPQQTKNIADLEKVSVTIEVFEETRKEGTSEQYTILVTEIAGEKYRVPKTVVRDLKVQIEANPALEFFRVRKQGTGREGTQYTVIPLP